MTKLNLFKYILFRIAGESFTSLAKNEAIYDVISKDLEALAGLEQQKAELKAGICEMLFDAIKAANTEADRKLLINFKRDFFNNRDIATEKAGVIKAILPPVLLTEYNQYETIVQQHRQVTVSINTHYIAAHQEDLNFIRYICGKDYFKNGLILSSDILLNYAKEYAATGKVDEGKLLGLWKYITRTIAKTTPYSTFTQLNMGELKQDLDGVVQVIDQSPAIKSEVRFNNYILELILSKIENYPLLYQRLNININSTLQETETELKYFTNNNNIESFQNIRKNGIITYILNRIRNEEAITFQELIDDLLSVLDTKYQKADVEKYVFELIQTGLLDIDINLSGLDSEWDISVRHMIEKYFGQEQLGKDIIDILQQLETFRKQYSTGNCDERQALSDKINILFNDIFILLDKDNVHQAAEISPHQPFTYDFIKAEKDMRNVFLHRLPAKMTIENFKNIIYEDTSKAIDIAVNEAAIAPVVEKINELINAFSFAFKTNYEKVANYQFYKKQFNVAPEISLLDFYEYLYKERSKPQPAQPQTPVVSENAEAAEKQPEPVVNVFERIRQFVFSEKDTGSILFSNNECEVTDVFLHNFHQHFNNEITEKQAMSYSAFMQFTKVTDNNDFRGIISGGILPGKGKMISRFLHLFPEQITTEINNWNKQTMPENALYAENSDASYFNANLHPGMMPYEIALPGGNTRSGNLIHVADLIIKPNDTTQELELYNKAGKRIIIFDLGFQSLMGRSHLYRLLNLFGNNYGFSHSSICGIFSGLYAQQIDVPDAKYKISIMPRISFGQVLVLQRKSWFVPVVIFKNLSHAKEAMDNYQAIQKWRNALKIPDEVFIRLHHYNPPPQQNQQQQVLQQPPKQKINRDDYKPQYINFLSPVCLKLFIKIVNKTTYANLTIEEMLPNSKQQLQIGDKRFASETLIQWE